MASFSQESDHSLGNILSKYDPNIHSFRIGLFGIVEYIILVDIRLADPSSPRCHILGIALFRALCALALLTSSTSSSL
jgi:hypothetical protein